MSLKPETTVKCLAGISWEINVGDDETTYKSELTGKSPTTIPSVGRRAQDAELDYAVRGILACAACLRPTGFQKDKCIIVNS